MLTVNGLYGHVARNNMRSVWMFLGFVIAYQLVGAGLLTLPLLFLDVKNFPILSPVSYFLNYGWIVLILSAVAFAYRYRNHMKNLQEELGFDHVTAMQNPRLVRIVDRVARTAGVEMPKVAVMPVDALNAFACGVKASTATVVVTEGLLNALNDDELEAVVAHEITHILNGDIRSMAFANVSISSVMKLARFNLLRMKDSWGRAIFGILFPPLFFLSMASGLVMHLAMTVARVTRLLIASSREYVADAEAVQLTHKPAALISALRKIDGRSDVPGLDPIADAMMIDGATIGEFATHPTIGERIDALRQHAGSMAHTLDDFKPDANAVFSRPNTAQPVDAGGNLLETVSGLLARKSSPFDVRTTHSDRTAAPKNLINRVNVGNDQNIFGVSQGLKKKMKVIGFVFIGLMMLSSLNMQRAFLSMSNVEKNVSGKMNKKSGEAKSEPAKSVRQLSTSSKSRETVVRPLEKSNQLPKFSDLAKTPENHPAVTPGAGKVTNAVLSTRTSGDATGSNEQAAQSTSARTVEPVAVKPRQAKDANKAEKPAETGLKPVAGSVVRKEAEGWSLR